MTTKMTKRSKRRSTPLTAEERVKIRDLHSHQGYSKVRLCEQFAIGYTTLQQVLEVAPSTPSPQQRARAKRGGHCWLVIAPTAPLMSQRVIHFSKSNLATALERLAEHVNNGTPASLYKKVEVALGAKLK